MFKNVKGSFREQEGMIRAFIIVNMLLRIVLSMSDKFGFFYLLGILYNLIMIYFLYVENITNSIVKTLRSKYVT